MTLTENDIRRMRASGIRVTGPDGKPFVGKINGQSELEYLRQLSSVLAAALEKQAMASNQEKSEPPKVTVNTPEVTVNPPIPIMKWRFSLSRDSDGRLKEIVATGIE